MHIPIVGNSYKCQNHVSTQYIYVLILLLASSHILSIILIQEIHATRQKTSASRVKLSKSTYAWPITLFESWKPIAHPPILFLHTKKGKPKQRIITTLLTTRRSHACHPFWNLMTQVSGLYHISRRINSFIASPKRSFDRVRNSSAAQGILHCLI